VSGVAPVTLLLGNGLRSGATFGLESLRLVRRTLAMTIFPFAHQADMFAIKMTSISHLALLLTRLLHKLLSLLKFRLVGVLSFAQETRTHPALQIGLKSDTMGH